MKNILAAAALLVCAVISTPTSLEKIEGRAPNTVNNLPSGDKQCGNNVFSPANIKNAINFGWQASKEGKTYKWNHKKAKASYPHQFSPDQMDLQWDDFNLPGCAQQGSDKSAKGKFLEYPIIVGDDAWSGQVGQGNDRVVFQYVDNDTAAFCGIIRHPGKDGVDNHFQLCENPRCGVHVTQHQKNENNVGPNYRLDITVKDAQGASVGSVDFEDAPEGQGVNVDSSLPSVLVVKAQKVDDDPLLFAYGAQSWDSNSGQCSVGKYDSGSRNMDCGFAC